jgi:hypothetical protein
LGFGTAFAFQPATPILATAVNETPPPELPRHPREELEHQSSPHWWIWTVVDIQQRLENWPMLRHILLEPKFRYAWLGCLLVLLTTLLGLPKIWIVTPPGVLPVIRVSWLNLIEARMHAGLARTAEANDEREAAFHHWRSAISFNPASPELLHGSIANLLQLAPRNSQYFSEARWNALWLLQLTRTNSASLDLFADASRHYGVDEMLVPVLVAAPQPLSAHQQLALVKAWLHLGDQPHFQNARTNLPSAVATSDAELPLYDAAAQALWGSTEDAEAGRRSLAAWQSTTNATLRVRALRLQLLASLTRRNLPDFTSALSALHELHEDYPLEHAAYWDLLRQMGRTADATRLALQFADPPVTSYEVMRLSEAFLQLGLTDHATQFLEHFAPSLGNTSSIWLTYAGLLIQHQSWDELRDLALEIRRNDLARTLLGGYSHYLEGLAEISTHHTNEAMLAFDKVPQSPIRENDLALWLAKDLISRGVFAPAAELLQSRETALRLRPDYWQMRIRTAYYQHDAEQLLYAAQHQLELIPDRLDAVNDLAAALLIGRRDPEQALALTRRVLDNNPTSVPARLNHAFALLQDGHAAAAKALLLSIDTFGLGEIERTMLAFAEVDLQRQQNHPTEALRAIAQVNTTYLLPPQIAWLEQVRSELEKQTARPP